MEKKRSKRRWNISDVGLKDEFTLLRPKPLQDLSLVTLWVEYLIFFQKLNLTLSYPFDSRGHLDRERTSKMVIVLLKHAILEVTLL